MAKKSMIARDAKRKKMVERFAAKRTALMAAFNAAEDPMERLEIHRKIQALPATALLPGCAIAAGQQGNQGVSIATSACAAISFGSVPTRVNSPEW